MQWGCVRNQHAWEMLDQWGCIQNQHGEIMTNGATYKINMHAWKMLTIVSKLKIATAVANLLKEA